MNKLILFFIFKTRLIFCFENSQEFDWPRSPRDIKSIILENIEEIGDAAAFSIATTGNLDKDLLRSNLSYEIQWLLYKKEAKNFSLDNIRCIDIDSNSQFIAYLKSDNIIELFDLENKHILSSFKCPENVIFLNICFNGKYICLLSNVEFNVWSIEDSRYCYIYKLKSKLSNKPCTKIFKATHHAARCIIELEDSSSIYDFISNQLISYSKNMLAMSNNGKIAAFREDKNLVVINLSDFSVLQIYENISPARIEFSIDDKYIYCFVDNYKVLKLDLKYNICASMIQVNSDCSGIFSTPRDLILLEDGYLIFKISIHSDNNNSILKKVCIGNLPLAISNKGNFFVISTDKTIELYDIKSCKMVKDLTAYDERPADIIISPNNKYIIIRYKLARFNKNVFIWSI